MRPAAENGTDMIISTFVNEYDKALDRAIARAKKKGVPP
jgi:hypothetical protein